jgi:hypothetical protein
MNDNLDSLEFALEPDCIKSLNAFEREGYQ